jgi:signal transduction histidine kinase
MSIELRGTSAKTMLNKNLLLRAFLNLGVNAIKYGIPRGSLVISVSEDTRAGNAVVMFSDDGIGVDEGDRSQLFKEGFRGTNVRDKYPGMGLGLSIAKAIIEAHSGVIELTSLRSPTVFKITLPMKRPAQADQPTLEHPSIIRMDRPSRRVQEPKGG